MKEENNPEPDAWSFVVKEAQLDPDENHRVVKWSDPDNPHSVEGIRHSDHAIEEKEPLFSAGTIQEADPRAKEIRCKNCDERVLIWDSTFLPVSFDCERCGEFDWEVCKELVPKEVFDADV